MQFTAITGLFAAVDGKVSARDLQLSAGYFAVSKPTLQVRVAPGVSVPLGSASSGLDFTLLTTGSFDPTLSVNLAAGESWLVLGGASLRVPVHPGFDRVRQGAYGRSDLRVAKRVGGGALTLGLSAAGQQTRGLSSPGFAELSAVAGASVPLSKTWAGDAGLRVPLWTNPTPRPYLLALQLGATHVFR